MTQYNAEKFSKDGQKYILSTLDLQVTNNRTIKDFKISIPVHLK